MNKSILILAAISGALAVILGAFGAHALKALISPEALENWKTAVTYQFIHTLAILVLANFPKSSHFRTAAWLFGLGILFFSGSLYLLSLREVCTLPSAILGPITPLGGLFFILGWLFLFRGALNQK